MVWKTASQTQDDAKTIAPMLPGIARILRRGARQLRLPRAGRYSTMACMTAFSKSRLRVRIDRLLDQQNTGQLFLAIDPEMGSERPVPAEASP